MGLLHCMRKQKKDAKIELSDLPKNYSVNRKRL